MTTTIRPARSEPAAEDWPSCGEADGVRWYGSTAGRDPLYCTGCGHHWLILIDEPTPATRRAMA